MTQLGNPKARASSRRSKEKVKVFVSHFSRDTWLARQIARHVQAAGAESFLDEADIEAGEDFEARILQTLDSCSELLVLLTPWSIMRPYIWMEIGAAWGQRKRIVGILYGITAQELGAKNGSPALLKRVSLLEINNLDRYFQELGRRVRTARAGHVS